MTKSPFWKRDLNLNLSEKERICNSNIKSAFKGPKYLSAACSPSDKEGQENHLLDDSPKKHPKSKFHSIRYVFLLKRCRNALGGPF